MIGGRHVNRRHQGAWCTDRRRPAPGRRACAVSEAAGFGRPYDHYQPAIEGPVPSKHATAVNPCRWSNRAASSPAERDPDAVIRPDRRCLRRNEGRRRVELLPRHVERRRSGGRGSTTTSDRHRDRPPAPIEQPTGRAAQPNHGRYGTISWILPVRRAHDLADVADRRSRCQSSTGRPIRSPTRTGCGKRRSIFSSGVQLAFSSACRLFAGGLRRGSDDPIAAPTSVACIAIAASSTAQIKSR